MATAQQIKALVESYIQCDDSRFRTVAMQIAAHSAKHGKKQLAEELRALLDEAASRRHLHVGPAKAIPIARPSQELSGLLAATFPKTQLSDMVLRDELRGELKRIVSEHRQRERLRSHGLSPRQRLLLVGPPGSGKTMTAFALAGECHLPLMSVQLHSLITKFMGETAAKLHQIFDAMEKTPAVYLFDEFDAIGSVRGGGKRRRRNPSSAEFLPAIPGAPHVG
jgi:SpoVK/Ycf46/Vps4 family AAA+-type ATPase